MSKPIRVPDATYSRLKAMSELNRRTLGGQLDYLMDFMEESFVETPSETSPTPKNIVLGTLPKPQEAEYTPQKNASEANASGVSDLFRDDTGRAGIDLEKPCCKNETQPCQHWVWDSQSGEGYVNRLSGRVMEVE